MEARLQYIRCKMELNEKHIFINPVHIHMHTRVRVHVNVRVRVRVQ